MTALLYYRRKEQHGRQEQLTEKRMRLNAQDLERYLSKVERRSDAECWIYTGTVNAMGYGFFHIRSKSYLVHRIAYRLEYGEIPTNKILRHTCDNPLCVNPRHLITGTPADNMRDRLERGRWAGGRPHGATDLTPAEVHEIRERHANGEKLIDIARNLDRGYAAVKNAACRRTFKAI